MTDMGAWRPFPQAPLLNRSDVDVGSQMQSVRFPILDSQNWVQGERQVPDSECGLAVIAACSARGGDVIRPPQQSTFAERGEAAVEYPAR